MFMTNLTGKVLYDHRGFTLLLLLLLLMMMMMMMMRYI